MLSRLSAGESSKKQDDSCSCLVPELNRVGVLGMYSNEEKSLYSSIASLGDSARPQATRIQKNCGVSMTSRVVRCFNRYRSYSVRRPKNSKRSFLVWSTASLSLRLFAMTNSATRSLISPSLIPKAIDCENECI